MIEYIPNDDAKDIAEQIIQDWHPHLEGVKIAYISKVKPPKKAKKGSPAKQPRQGKKIVMAKAAKVSPKMQALMSDGYVFVIEFNDAIWQELAHEKRIALVDHELCHLGSDADGFYLKGHSVEEFREIIKRHGFWKDDVRQFAEQTEQIYHEQEVSA